ncbi:MAG: nylA [Frankiales bacterium]|jgi:amidase|nr:nylA [Frankiales bacterium]
MSDFDACAQAELVRTGQASPAELVDEAISRIEQYEPSVHALVRDRFEQAREQARGDLPDGPFRGVPLLLKDLGCHLAGEATHYGAGFLRDADWRAPVDSHLGRAFTDAGFVLLGRTATPEFGTTITTESRAYGATRNPYDLSRSTGGSSGGSAAAVAYGGVPVAHAGDGGGSIRIPASECGLVGLKPTRGRVSQGPQVGESWAGATVDGCVTRTVRDTAAVLDVVSRPMPGDPYSAPRPARPFAQEVGADPGRLRVGLLPVPPQEDLDADPDCQQAVEAAGRLLQSLGHTVELAHPAELGASEFSRHFGRTVGADVALMVQQFEKDLGREIADEELEPRNAAYRGMGRAMRATAYLESRAWLGVFSRRVAAWWATPEEGGEGFDVLVTPVLGTPPPPIDWVGADGDLAVSAQRVRALMPYTAQFNVTGQPAVSLPLHTTADGLPVGVQFVGAYGREDLLLRLASQLEQAAPWRDRRPPLPA